MAAIPKSDRNPPATPCFTTSRNRISESGPQRRGRARVPKVDQACSGGIPNSYAMLAQMLSDHERSEEAAPLFRAASGKEPRITTKAWSNLAKALIEEDPVAGSRAGSK